MFLVVGISFQYYVHGGGHFFSILCAWWRAFLFNIVCMVEGIFLTHQIGITVVLSHIPVPALGEDKLGVPDCPEALT